MVVRRAQARRGFKIKLPSPFNWWRPPFGQFGADLRFNFFLADNCRRLGRHALCGPAVLHRAARTARFARAFVYPALPRPSAQGSARLCFSYNSFALSTLSHRLRCPRTPVVAVRLHYRVVAGIVHGSASVYSARTSILWLIKTSVGSRSQP